MNPNENNLRSLPGVDTLIQTREIRSFFGYFGRPLTVEAVRTALAIYRSRLIAGEDAPSHSDIVNLVSRQLRDWVTPTLKPVINATGVILHTNLGRAPLGNAAFEAIYKTNRVYNTLEYDIERGTRGSRTIHTEAMLTHLTGAEAALVVNNNAAAVMLALTALANRRRVIIARSQLVEIGGGFRIPEVMKLSGARLVEVGTTNRVHVADFENALSEPAALLLRVHHSNYQIVGFTSEPELSEIVAVGQRYGVPVLDDLGSGTLLDTSRYGLTHEPTVQESIAAGADLVCFSGDKLLGGPQAGIIVGRADLISKIKKHPFARAVRADKLALAALTGTLDYYLRDEAEQEIPVWQMISLPIEKIRTRAEHWQKELKLGEVIPSQSTIGGGSLPGQTLPTFVLAIDKDQPNQVLSRLRSHTVPIIARIENDRVVLDPRTVLTEQDGSLMVGLRFNL
jgi:L-seryl-tRNA(Ser) seleniumtransferase